jgi:hypothetical protein
VLSVSPRTIDLPIETSVENSAAGIDPANRAIADLVDLASQTSDVLRALIDQGQLSERKASRAALHLQERLRLSARMLKAFQSQISRLESGLAEMRDHERRLHSLEAQIEKRAEFMAQTPMENQTGIVADPSKHEHDRVQVAELMLMMRDIAKRIDGLTVLNSNQRSQVQRRGNLQSSQVEAKADCASANEPVAPPLRYHG